MAGVGRLKDSNYYLDQAEAKMNEAEKDIVYLRSNGVSELEANIWRQWIEIKVNMATAYAAIANVKKVRR